jgi:CobQ-like glutamine amidotransferase family enzyme
MSLKLVHLYPAHMNLYGDRGNLLVLARRAEWRGYPVEIVEVAPGDPVPWATADFLFIGGGEDRHQAMIADDFLARRADLKAALGDGLPMLAICGGFQLLGHTYVTASGETLPGVGWFDAETRSGSVRCIGNVLVDAALDLEPATLVGFENHGGRTYLSGEQAPLGRVRKGAGYGNNGEDGLEGAVRHRTIGTYLHGSLLPKNPQLADLLLTWALQYRSGQAEMAPLDDRWELLAHQSAARKAAGDPRPGR